MNLKHIISALGMIALSAGLLSCDDDNEGSCLKRNTDKLEFSFLNSTKDLYVLTDHNWSIIPGEDWISCTPSSGKGASTEQIVGVTVKQNDGTEREGYVTLTDGVKEIKITVTQEDGFFYFDKVVMPDIFLNQPLANKSIDIPYHKSKPGYIANGTCELLLDGEAYDEITATPIVDKEMGLGDGSLSFALSGTPTKRGVLTAKITTNVNGTSESRSGECRIRLETEVKVEVFKLLPRFVVLDWGKYVRGTGTNGDNGTSRDFDFELAYTKDGEAIRKSVTSSTNWLVASIFWPENRFCYGNLKPGTEYWFRIKQKKIGANKDMTTDVTYLQFTTPEEPELPANTVFYEDFDKWSIKGSAIYRAFGTAISNAKVKAGFDPNNDADYLSNTGICTPVTTMDPIDNYKTNTTHALYTPNIPKIWEHYYQADIYGYDNFTDASKYRGWFSYFARHSTGGVMLGGATTSGAYIGTPRLDALGDTPTDITIVTNTAAYHEPFHSWAEDCLYHHIQIDGPGKIVDGGPTAATSGIPSTATPNGDKSVVVKVAPNKIGPSQGPINDWNVTTKHTVKVQGATKDTRVIIKNMTVGADAAHCRVLIDDIMITKD